MSISTKLSDLIAATAGGGDLIYIVQGGNSRQVALGAIGAGLLDDTGQTTALTTLGGGAKGRAIFQDTGSTAVLTELGFSALARDLIDDTGQTAMISTLGLGTAAVKNVGTSGDAVPLLNAANTWSDQQIFAGTGENIKLQSPNSGLGPCYVRFADSAGLAIGYVGLGSGSTNRLDLVRNDTGEIYMGSVFGTFKVDAATTIIDDGFSTLAAAQAVTIPARIRGVTTHGHTNVNDGGGAQWIDTGAQPTTHDAWFKDAASHYFVIKNPTLDIRQFGVFGSDDTGTMTNEGTNILKAFTAAIKLKRPLFVPGRHYQSGALSYTSDDIALVLEGDPSTQPQFHATLAVANSTGGSGRLMQFLPGGSSYTSNEVGSFTLAANVSPFQQKITLNSVTGIEPGMMIQLASNQLWYYDDRGTYYRGEIHLIQKVLSGNRVQIDDYTRDTYLTSQTITVRVWRPRRFIMNNIGIVFPDPTDTGANTRGVVIDRMMKPEFNDCLFKGMTGSGVLNSRSWLAKYNNIEIQDVGRAISASNSIGYGVNESSVYGTIFDGIKSRGCRRTIDFDALTSQTLTAVTRDCIVKNFHVTGSGVDGVGQEFFPDGSSPNYGIGGHGSVENLKILDGFIADVQEGINIRSRNTHISRVHFAGEMQHCFKGTFGTGLVIQDCQYMRDDYPDKTSDTGAANTYHARLPYSFARFGIASGNGDWDYESPVVIQNNVAHGLQRSFIEFGVSPGPISMENLYIHDNTARLHIPSGAEFNFFFVDDSGDARLFRSKIGPNKAVNRGAGTTEMYHSALTLGSANQGGSDAAIEIGDHEWVITLADDTVGVIRDALRYSLDRAAILLADQSNNTYGHFILSNGSSTTISLGAMSATLAATASGSSMTGTTGTDGNFTVGLTNGDLYMENRTAASRRLRVRIM